MGSNGNTDASPQDDKATKNRPAACDTAASHGYALKACLMVVLAVVCLGVNWMLSADTPKLRNAPTGTFSYNNYVDGRGRPYSVRGRRINLSAREMDSWKAERDFHITMRFARYVLTGLAVVFGIAAVAYVMLSLRAGRREQHAA